MHRFVLNFLCFLLFLTHITSVSAVYNPLSQPNNKVGVHILFTEELKEAASLVNANGGQWGYVIIPIQSGDKDLAKWQKFMDEAKALKVIPIIRIATEGDYFNTRVWRKPKEEDILDFANFLSSLLWPTKNRYIVVFNEVNRADEWGGELSPSDYASLLSYAVTVFKSKSQDFFMISAGMDNASANVQGVSMNQFDYIRQMNAYFPGIFHQIDGLGSHSYPNPGFSQPPTRLDSQSIASFRYESALIESITGKKLPTFVAETGWSTNAVSDFVASIYYQTAFASVWSDENVVSVTPFILKAHSGPFTAFTLLFQDGSKTKQYQAIEGLPKIKGEPLLAEEVLGTSVKKQEKLPTKRFLPTQTLSSTAITVPNTVKEVAVWLLKLDL